MNCYSRTYDRDGRQIGTQLTSQTVPAVDVVEFEDRFELYLATPGVAKEDYELKVEDGVLTVAFDRKTPYDMNAVVSMRQQLTYGRIERRFRLSNKIDTTNIEAVADNGLLKIVLAKKQIDVFRVNVH